MLVHQGYISWCRTPQHLSRDACIPRPSSVCTQTPSTTSGIDTTCSAWARRRDRCGCCTKSGGGLRRLWARTRSSNRTATSSCQPSSNARCAQGRGLSTTTRFARVMMIYCPSRCGMHASTPTSRAERSAGFGLRISAQPSL